ncbi:MAG: hypothetical protein HY908_13640 [Myxococcales bacterium]|nr:hypothetical protein [Myxococcales bacterium]
MGILSWLFPTEQDRLVRARALMAKGRHADARAALLHSKLPEAEELYEQCSAVLDAKERTAQKKALAAQGFHGWKIQVSTKNARRRAELEALVAAELEKAGVDLALPELDEKAAKTALARAERRVRGGGGGAVRVELVPMVDEARLKASR